MLKKRIIPCLDVKDGRVVKGVNFVNLTDVGDPVDSARAYYEAGCDELVFLDITATSDNRETTVDMVRRVADQVFIPFTVGGGIRSVEDMNKMLKAGADKVAVNSSAHANPQLISDCAQNLAISVSWLRLMLKRWLMGAGMFLWQVAVRILVGISSNWLKKSSPWGLEKFS